jgi:hypothetical protein
MRLSHNSFIFETLPCVGQMFIPGDSMNALIVRRLPWQSSVGFLALAASLAAPAFANTPSTFDPVVRIQSATSGGTGSLVSTGQVGNEYLMTFLMADHTVQRIGQLTTVGFGDSSAPKLNLSLASATNITLYDKGPGGIEDMALLGVTIDLATLSAADRAYLTSVTPLALQAAPTQLSPFAMTAYGFGRSGGVTSYGTQQSFNNVIDAYNNGFSGSYTTDANNIPLVYTQDMLHWTYNDQYTGDWITGEGAGYGGYSGSPLTVLVNGKATIFGIQSAGSDVTNGAQNIGLKFNDSYVNWINANSAAYLATAQVAPPVPEPESYALLLAGLGLIGVAARRKRG